MNEGKKITFFCVFDWFQVAFRSESLDTMIVRREVAVRLYNDSSHVYMSHGKLFSVFMLYTTKDGSCLISSNIDLSTMQPGYYRDGEGSVNIRQARALFVVMPSQDSS